MKLYQHNGHTVYACPSAWGNVYVIVREGAPAYVTDALDTVVLITGGGLPPELAPLPAVDPRPPAV